MDDGTWSNPDLVTVTGGSVGAEVGRMVTDMVKIYRTRKGAGDAPDHGLVIGIGAGFAFYLTRPREFNGPDPESKTTTDVVTYERKRGMHLGAAILGEVRAHRASSIAEAPPPTTVRPVPGTTGNATAPV